MTDNAREFVATKLWLFVAVVTFPLTALTAIFAGALPWMAGFTDLLVPAVPILGWFLLTPILLFFGEEVATFVYGPAEDEAPSVEGSEPSTATEDDAVDLLKRRYARGELTDAEFERKLERLVELDQVDVADADVDVLLGDDETVLDADEQERDDGREAFDLERE